jgi:hypothetical protein
MLLVIATPAGHKRGGTFSIQSSDHANCARGPKRGADGYPIGSGARSATLLLALFLADAVPAGNRVQ